MEEKSLRRLRSALQFGGLPVREFISRTYENLIAHELLTRASAIAYYAMLATLPFLSLVLTMILQWLPKIGEGSGVAESLEDTLNMMLPREAFELVRDQLVRIQENPPIGLMSLSLIATLWFASSLFMAVIEAMNVVNGVKETRNFLLLRLKAIAMTVLQAVVFVGSLLVIVSWPVLMEFLGVQGSLEVLASCIKWIVLLSGVLLSFAFTFYVAPDSDQRWEWISPGSILGTPIFLGFSYLFRFYVKNFANYNETYGSLGGVMCLLLWFWITALIVLIAGETNMIIEDASPLGKNFGERREKPAKLSRQ